MATVSKITLPNNSAFDLRASAIPYGSVNSSSTATAFSATVPGVLALTDGTCVMLKNDVVSASSGGFTLNVNSLGSKPVYSSSSSSQEGQAFNVNYTMLFVYDSQRVSGGCWVCYRGYSTGGGGGGGEPSSSFITTTTTISTTDWSSNSCTKTVSGVTLSNDVIVSYSPSSKEVYLSAGIYCSAQGADSLTFNCGVVPSSSVTVNVMILDPSTDGDLLGYGSEE